MPDDRNGRRDVPRNGHHLNGASVPPHPYTRVLSADPDDALDMVALQADDELVTAVGTRQVASRGVAGPPFAPPPGGDDRLVSLLAAWRDEIDAEPIPELVDLDTAVAAVVAGARADELAARRRKTARLRQLAPLAAAAAIIVATVTGVGLGSQNAMPGDTLWPVQKVVNPERAQSVEAKIEVESRLQNVRAALAKGDTVAAAHELDEIRTQIPAVRGQEGLPLLLQEQEFLAAKLADTPPGTPADLTTPPTSNPKARSTSSPVPPPAPASSPADPSVSTSKSGSAAPESTSPDARARERAGVAGAPGEPKAPGPGPAPEPQVTAAPDVAKPDPTGPANGEGTPDKTVAPDPPAPPPAVPGPDTGASSSGAPGSDTTTASGSAGAIVEATATDTTTS